MSGSMATDVVGEHTLVEKESQGIFTRTEYACTKCGKMMPEKSDFESEDCGSDYGW